MFNNAKSLLIVLPLVVACHEEEVEFGRPAGPPIVFRVEVEEGTEGAIPCDYLENSSGTIWFGPGHPYHLHDAGVAMGSTGVPAVSFEIVPGMKQPFLDFTESIVNKRMAIEIQGKIYGAPVVHSRLPGGVIIEGGVKGFTQEEAEELVQILWKGSDN